MKKQNIKTKSGFTIIEVVLVLAIAGLIFLMVFIALPALQRSQRDTQRRDDMARLATALTNWQTNHGNNLPTTDTDGTTLLDDYLKRNNGEFQEPDGGNYELNIIEATGQTDFESAERPMINLYLNAYCNNGTAAFQSGSRKYAIVYKLEGSGDFCQDNQ